MYLLVRFKTDDTINWKGFSAAFVLASPDAQPVTQIGGTRKYDVDYVPKPNKKYPDKGDPGSYPIDGGGWVANDSQRWALVHAAWNECFCKWEYMENFV